MDDREDTDTASSYGVASYQASVGNYDSFLAQTWTDPVSGDSGSADIGTIYLVKYGNAKRLIDG